MTTESAKKILVIQMTKMGDFLQTTPLLRALKRRHPEAELSVLIPPSLAGVAAGCPAVDRAVTLDLHSLQALALRPDLTVAQKMQAARAETQPLAAERFDRVININYSPVTALLSELIPTDHRAGYHYGDQRRHLLREEWTNFIFQHMTDRRLVRFNLVDMLLNYAPQAGPEAPVFEYDDEAGRWAEERLAAPAGNGPVWGLQIGAKNRLRRWPVENFADLAAQILTRYPVRLVLTGTTDEKPLARQFLDRLAESGLPLADRVLDLVGRTSLRRLAAILDRLARLITGDTGTMHLATAVGTPVLALFMGPAHCHETGPYGPGHVVLQAVAPCFPCQEAAESCGEEDCRPIITPEIAAAALEDNLDPGAFPDQVVPYRSRLDSFGVVYRPLIKRPLGVETALALALREAGRRYLRPDYVVDPDRFKAEVGRDYSPPEDRDGAVLGGVKSNLDLIGGVIKKGAPSTGHLAQELILTARGLDFSVSLHPR
ncbi:MAG: glycosyltransferase family 9 protein, partial [Proteobacteria bacterium]|nr:glycosyltransferase family 9 protein [Pseudomonadota bacterium]MBU1741252.1 glycosyltransferase family 9 protein [Pseudomonadota bacterium]